MATVRSSRSRFENASKRYADKVDKIKSLEWPTITPELRRSCARSNPDSGFGAAGQKTNGVELTDLDGRVAIVTGGARGIGAATAIELARHGASIAIFDICDPDQAAATLSAVREFGTSPLFYQGTVADRQATDRMVEATAQRFGHIDILVNNAGINIRKPLLELEVQDVAKVWDVVLWGTFHCTQLTARRMVAQDKGGSIVMVSSVHAYRPFVLSTAYNGAKAAVNHMAATWAAELASARIRVNVIEPGWIDTPGETATFGEEIIREEGRKLPMGRLGSPEEIARAVRFLVSEDGSYITGTSLRVDGGIVLTR
jgi:glucose 1-dehydrogenase